MQDLVGNIWQLSHFLYDWIVVPTNIGWTKAGLNVMGRGLAQQAKERHPELAEWYGEMCRRHRMRLGIVSRRFLGPRGGRNLILFPVKPLDAENPHLSWQQPADLVLIEENLEQLAKFIPSDGQGRVLVPLLGCGNGGLNPVDVRPRIEKHLGSRGHFVLVYRSEAERERAQ